jgi:hypothetical protein
MVRESDRPGVQVVPAAIAIDVDQTPEAQRWNEEPSAEQNHSPSSVQGPDCAPAVGVVPLGAGAPADAAEEAAAGAWLAGIGETTAVDVATGAADEAPVAKTPGEPAEDGAEPRPGADEAEGELPPTPDEVAAGAGPDDGVPAAPPAAAAQAGAGCRLVLMAPFWTEEPGSGYRVSSPSIVMQSLTLWRLATNIAGKLDWRLKTDGAGA